jgi:plasmid maintenance system antidote protein VapI
VTDSERIIALCEYLKIEIAPFARSIGRTPGTIYHIKDGLNKISIKLAKDIAEKYDTIRYEWLLDGRGEMLNNAVNDQQVVYNRKDSDSKELERQLIECQNLLKAVTQERDWLREFLKDISKNGSGRMSGVGS